MTVQALVFMCYIIVKFSLLKEKFETDRERKKRQREEERRRGKKGEEKGRREKKHRAIGKVEPGDRAYWQSFGSDHPPPSYSDPVDS